MGTGKENKELIVQTGKKSVLMVMVSTLLGADYHGVDDVRDPFVSLPADRCWYGRRVLESYWIVLHRLNPIPTTLTCIFLSTSLVLLFLSLAIVTATSYPVCSKLIFWCIAWSIRVIQPQLPAVRFLLLKLLHAFHSALRINELNMGEASGLTGPSINGNADFNNVLDRLEKCIQITISHFEGHVAEEEGIGRWIEGLLRSFC